MVPRVCFSPSTRYGLAIAKLIPALLHVTRLSLSATLQTRDFYTNTWKTGRFSLILIVVCVPLPTWQALTTVCWRRRLLTAGNL